MMMMMLLRMLKVAANCTNILHSTEIAFVGQRQFSYPSYLRFIISSVMQIMHMSVCLSVCLSVRARAEGLLGKNQRGVEPM